LNLPFRLDPRETLRFLDVCVRMHIFIGVGYAMLLVFFDDFILKRPG